MKFTYQLTTPTLRQRQIVDVEVNSYVNPIDDRSIRIQLSSIRDRFRQFGGSHIFRAANCRHQGYLLYIFFYYFRFLNLFLLLSILIAR